MTYNETIKALKECLSEPCSEQAYIKAVRNALFLINHQNAEIERLQKECETTRAYIHNNGLEWGLVSHLEFCKNQRSEARKEFVEKLKERNKVYCTNSELLKEMNFVADNLLEEMEKEND